MARLSPCFTISSPSTQYTHDYIQSDKGIPGKYNTTKCARYDDIFGESIAGGAQLEILWGRVNATHSDGLRLRAFPNIENKIRNELKIVRSFYSGCDALENKHVFFLEIKYKIGNLTLQYNARPLSYTENHISRLIPNHKENNHNSITGYYYYRLLISIVYCLFKVYFIKQLSFHEFIELNPKNGKS